MKRILCDQLPTPKASVTIPEDEARHAVQVFRLRNGDELEALDGKGHSVIGSISIKGDEVRLHFVRENRVTQASEQVLPIELEVAALKGDAMEWVIEKAVELGVRRLIPVLTAHTVVQVGNKTPEQFRERWQKIADQALKQCGRLEKLEVTLPVKLEEHLTRPIDGTRLWCDETASDAPFILDTSPPSKTTLLIGPEGGWSAEERALLSCAAGTTRVHLGPNILRAETAALFAISLVAGRLRHNLTLDPKLDKTTSKGSLSE